MLYFLTFTCYGSHLPGDARGSADHVRKGEHRLIAPAPMLESQQRYSMRQDPYLLSTPQHRVLVRDAIVEVCRHRSWMLYGLHVRTNHVHGIVGAEATPSRIFHDWKAYASRALQDSGRIHWTHGGNVRHIKTTEQLNSFMRYILHNQGDPMETYWCDPRVTPAITGGASHGEVQRQSD